eukprot:352832-Chlamydomonas_euryale.AAC.1
MESTSSAHRQHACKRPAHRRLCLNSRLVGAGALRAAWCCSPQQWSHQCWSPHQWSHQCWSPCTVLSSEGLPSNGLSRDGLPSETGSQAKVSLALDSLALSSRAIGSQAMVFLAMVSLVRRAPWRHGCPHRVFRGNAPLHVPRPRLTQLHAPVSADAHAPKPSSALMSRTFAPHFPPTHPRSTPTLYSTTGSVNSIGRHGSSPRASCITSSAPCSCGSSSSRRRCREFAILRCTCSYGDASTEHGAPGNPLKSARRRDAWRVVR